MKFTNAQLPCVMCAGKQQLTFQGKIKPLQGQTKAMLATTFSLSNKRVQLVAKQSDIKFLDCSSPDKKGFKNCDKSIKECFDDCVKTLSNFKCYAKCPDLTSWDDVETTSSSATVYYLVNPKRTQNFIKCYDM